MQKLARSLSVLLVVGSAGVVLAKDADASKRSLVSIELSIVELPGVALAEKGDRAGGLDAESTEKLIARVREMEAKGLVTGWTRMRLSTVEECKAMAQFGERAAVVSGRNQFGPARGGGERNPSGNVYTFQEFGTMVSVTPRVEESGAILIELQVEKTGPTREVRREAGDPANADSGVPPSIGIVQVQSTVRVQNEQTVIVQGMNSSSEKGAAQTVILLTARAEQPAKAVAAKGDADGAVEEIKIFSLRNAKASSVASVMTSLFEGQPLSVGVDQRTNSLIVRSSSRQLELVEAVLLRLDEAPAAEATSR